MVHNPVWAICERVAEVQALLDDHINGGRFSSISSPASATPEAMRQQTFR